MNKITTRIKHYTFDLNDYHVGDPLVTWWVLDIDKNGVEFAKPFNPEEEKLFLSFILSMPDNFPAEKNTFISDNSDAPQVDLTKPTLGKPELIVLRRTPMRYGGKINNVMDVRLYPKHTYDLPFFVVGEFG